MRAGLTAADAGRANSFGAAEARRDAATLAEVSEALRHVGLVGVGVGWASPRPNPNPEQLSEALRHVGLEKYEQWQAWRSG